MPLDSASTRSQAPKVEMLSLSSVKESPSNPRRTFRGIEDLAADVKLRGILQPILVRPLIDIVAGGRGEQHNGYEIVFGARRYRAAQLAQLDALPAFVRRMSDEEALEVQLVENSKREDIHPLEEADGYCVLHEKYKHSVEEIAAKVGKSRSAVYERIKLCALVPSARTAFLDGKLTASTALLIARIPDKELQAKAVGDLAQGSEHDSAMSYRQAVNHVQQNYMLQLKDAPFDTADAKLLPKAGACTVCPKRTGNQAELFADVHSPDVCTDPTCYGEKKDALWKLQVAKAKEVGQKVLPAGEAKKVFQFGNIRYDANFVDLDAKDYGHGGKTYRQLLPKKDAPAPVLARDEKGDVHELLPTTTFNKLTGRKERTSPTYDPKKIREQQKAHEREAKQREQVEHAVIAKLVAAAEKGATTAAFWRLLVRVLTHEPYMVGGTLRRRGLKHEGLRKQLPKLNDRQLRGLLLELVLELSQDGVATDPGEGPDDAIEDACQVLGVDYAKTVSQVLDPTVAQSCPVCHRVVGVKEGKFDKHETREGKPCASSGKDIPPSKYKADSPGPKERRR